MSNHISHAALPYPFKGCRYTFALTYFDASGTPTDPSSPDTERSIDAAAFADCTEEATTVSGSNGMAYITLTGDETNGSLIMVAPKAATEPKVRIALQPRVLPVVLSGTAQSGATGTITLPSGAVAIDDYYNGMIIRTTGGIGGGGGSGSRDNQARVITDYVGSTKVASISPNWETTPDNTTTLEVLMTETALLHFSNAVSLSTQVKADVNAEMVDALTVDVIADSVAADGSRPTVAQALLMITRFLMEKSVLSTTVTVKKEDGTTDSMTFTLDNGTTPTSITRAT